MQASTKDTNALPMNRWIGSDKSKPENCMAATHHNNHSKLNYGLNKFSKSHSLPQELMRNLSMNKDLLDLKRVNQFLRLLIVNHQRTVK